MPSFRLISLKSETNQSEIGKSALFKGSRDLVVGDFHTMADCVIAPGATITGGTSIGARCQIGAGATIDDCIIGDDVTVGAGASLTRSFLAHGR